MMDGRNGSSNPAIIGPTLGILAYVIESFEYASYPNIMYITGSEELVIYICIYRCPIGFLWYNAFPAQVFMGDTGSLTIGGIMPYLSSYI